MTQTAQNTRPAPPVRLGRLSFINVDPVYYGFEYEHLSGALAIHSAPPADLNRMLAEGRLDISSVSSAAYGLHHHDWQLLPGVSIACTGDVMSVLLVGRRPLDALGGRRVLVTNESATAVRLMKLMFAHRGITPVLETVKVHEPSDVDDDAAGALVIGDAALRHDWHGEFEFVWDLGDLWARHASLPFVFAVWAVRREFAAAHPDRVREAVRLLDTSKRMGLSHLDPLIRTASAKLGIPPETVRRYFENFCYDLGAAETAGLETYFKDLYRMGIFREEVRIDFFD